MKAVLPSAAAQLDVTQPALSQAISALEERLQIRLLTRTTRSVSPTSAGERLLLAIGNRIDEIEAELDILTELRDKPAGTVRITCGPNVLHSTLLPKLAPCCVSIRILILSSTQTMVSATLWRTALMREYAWVTPLIKT